MANRNSVNGGNGSDEEGEFNNGALNDVENRVEAGEDSEEALPAVPRDEVEENNNQLGLDPPQLNPQEEEVAQSEEEDASSPSICNPQSPQISPGSGSSTNVRTDGMRRASDLLMAVSVAADRNKSKIIDLAIDALEELIKMALKGEPLWQRVGDMEILNGIQYLKQFGYFDSTMEEIVRLVEAGEPPFFPSSCCGKKVASSSQNAPPPIVPLQFGGLEPLHIESSREIGFVNAKAANIVQALMDSNNYATTFSTIVTRATLLAVLLDGVEGSYDGTVQVMAAEFHQCSPLVPTRKSSFARYCRQLGSGKWGVVDVSLENLFPYPRVQFRRRPSGCLIEQMPDGISSKVTWVEHVEVDNRAVHPLFHEIISSGFGFGAKRWIAAINRHFQWLATISNTTSAVLPIPAGRESILKLVERMTRDYFANVSSCSENFWMQLPREICNNPDHRFRFGKTLVVPGKPPSNTFVFTTSIQLPIPPKILFDFLRTAQSRHQWDLLSNGRTVREIAYILNGVHPENRISIQRTNCTPQNSVEILYLQESYSDETGYYVIYAPVDIFAMSTILNGGNPYFTSILPSGFVILPDKPSPDLVEGRSVGSILTIAFHSADEVSSEDYIPTVSLRTIDGVLTTTAASIRKAFTPGHRCGRQSVGK